MAGKNEGGDEIHSAAGDDSKNIATGKRIEQDNRTTGATYYNYAAPDTPSLRLTLEQRMDRQEATMADLIESLYGNTQRIRDGNRRQQEGNRLEAIENELERLKGNRPLPVSFNTALLVVILIIFFFILLALTATWLQNSGPKTVTLSLLQFITQAAPYWRMYTLWTGLIGY